MGRPFKHPRGKFARCKHPFCSDCKTRRGNKRATRAERRAAKKEIRR